MHLPFVKRLTLAPRRHLLALCVVSALAIQPQMSHAQSNQTPESDAEIVFIPPATGAPADRLGAGTRDIGTSDASVQLLVPPQGGLSAKAQPLLVWHFGEPVDGPVRVAITPLGGLARGFVFTLNGKFAQGFHALNLARSKLELTSGQLYRWQIDWPNASPSAVGLIEYRPVDDTLSSAAQAAAAGYWYDTVAFLFDVGFSGRVRLINATGLQSAALGAGLDLTNQFPERE